MCVPLGEQQFPATLSCRMRLYKLFVAAVGVEAENLAETEHLGAFPKGERERCGRGHFCRCKMFSQKNLGVHSHSCRRVKLITEANDCSSCQIHPELLSEAAASLAASQHIKLH